eukprot:Rmarinus@m.9349
MSHKGGYATAVEARSRGRGSRKGYASESGHRRTAPVRQGGQPSYLQAVISGDRKVYIMTPPKDYDEMIGLQNRYNIHLLIGMIEEDKALPPQAFDRTPLIRHEIFDTPKGTVPSVDDVQFILGLLDDTLHGTSESGQAVSSVGIYSEDGLNRAALIPACYLIRNNNQTMENAFFEVNKASRDHNTLLQHLLEDFDFRSLQHPNPKEAKEASKQLDIEKTAAMRKTRKENGSEYCIFLRHFWGKIHGEGKKGPVHIPEYEGQHANDWSKNEDAEKLWLEKAGVDELNRIYSWCEEGQRHWPNKKLEAGGGAISKLTKTLLNSCTIVHKWLKHAAFQDYVNMLKEHSRNPETSVVACLSRLLLEEKEKREAERDFGYDHYDHHTNIGNGHAAYEPGNEDYEPADDAGFDVI